MWETASGESLTGRVRGFNRFYTRLIGVLDRGYLKTPYSLQEARVLYELGASRGSTSKDLRGRTGFDQGYLSRLLARLTRARLIRRVESRKDGRVRHLFLTTTGKTAFRTLNERADVQIGELIGGLREDQRRDLVASLDTVRGLLDPSLPPERFAIVTSATRPLAVARLGYASIPVPMNMVAAEDVSQGKPFPEPYLKGAARLGLAPADCLVFEDTPAGISAAHAAGMRVIAVGTTYSEEELREADAVVRSLEDVQAGLRGQDLELTLAAVSAGKK